VTGAVHAGALLSGLPDARAEERTTQLLSLPGARIERIVSAGQVSPDGFWYDQDQAEFVVLLAGSASLRIAGETVVRDLGPGDYVFLPAHRRHRVERTSVMPPAVWLAVHLG
jgi:cupin 2 domain-containing protein